MQLRQHLFFYVILWQHYSMINAIILSSAMQVMQCLIQLCQ